MPDALDYLILAAHPDDAELFCGGTIIKMRELGYSVGILDFSRGEAATCGTVEMRDAETVAADAILQPAWRANLCLPDSNLRDDDATRRLVVDIIRQFRVKMLIAPVDSCRHPDHAAVAAVARNASFFAGAGTFPSDYSPWRPQGLIRHPEYEDVPPSFVVDISSQYAAKMAATACYASQFYTSATGEKATIAGSRRFYERMVSRFRHYGNLAGVEYGEPFIADGQLRVEDPLRHVGVQ